MDILLYNSSLQLIGVVDEYEGMVWTSRMFDHGEFSLRTSKYSIFNEPPQTGGVAYVGRSDSSEVCLIEGFRFDGTSIEVFGRNASSMLNGRIINTPVVFSNFTNFGYVVDELIDSATETRGTWTRTLPQWDFSTFYDVGLPTVASFNSSYRPLDVCIYDVIRTFGYGMRTFVKDVSGTNYLDFAFLAPTESFAVFGTAYGDVIEFEREVNYAEFYERVIVSGETYTGAISTSTGSDETRNLSDLVFPENKELYLASDIRQGSMTDTAFYNALTQRGLEELKTRGTDSIKISVDESRLTYGADYSLGSIVRAICGTTEVYDLISSVTETFEKGGRTLDLGIGETAPTLKRYLKRLEN